MRGTILLSHNENTKKVEEEEKNRFLRSLLEQMGVPISEVWTDDTDISIDQKIKLRMMLSAYNIQIIDDLDGGLQVYVDKEKVASFEKPTFKLKRDYSELDPRKQLYIEMTLEFNSLFEDLDPQE